MIGAYTSRLARLAISLLLLAAVAITPLHTIFAQKKAKTKRDNNWESTPDARGYIKPFQSRPSAQAIKWANFRLRHMSLDEKLGQLISIGINGRFLNQDSEAYRALRHQVEENHVGGIVLFRGSVYESVHLVNRMQKLARDPLLISADMEFGAAMRFEDTVSIPWNMAISATGNPQYAQQQGEIIAREARALGVKQIFGPVVDVNSNSANPIINVRAYSEDPMEVSKYSVAFIKGTQGGGVMATAKHFPGHGDTAIDSHRGLPIIDVNRARLDRLELIPYRAAIAAGVGSVMVAYIGLPQIDPTVIKPLPRDMIARPSYVTEGDEIVTENATLPAALSPAVVDGLLKSDLRFDGLVVTDALDMSGLTIYFSQDEAAVRAIEAGADMLIKPSDPDAAVRGLRRAVQVGRISEKRIEKSVRRILAVKYDLGLVHKRYTPLDQIDHLLSNSEAVAFAKEVAEHAITLVRNDANLVPIRLQPNSKILNLVITNGDDRLSIATPFVREMARRGRHVETVVLDGRSTEEEINQAIKQVRGADLTIASLYGRVRAGESRSADLPEPVARALAKLSESNIPLVGISFGNPYLLQSFPQLQTYIIAYGDMPSLQEAAATALLGETDITGRLPITLPSLYPRGTGIQVKASVEK